MLLMTLGVSQSIADVSEYPSPNKRYSLRVYFTEGPDRGKFEIVNSKTGKVLYAEPGCNEGGNISVYVSWTQSSAT